MLRVHLSGFEKCFSFNSDHVLISIHYTQECISNIYVNLDDYGLQLIKTQFKSQKI